VTSYGTTQNRQRYSITFVALGQTANQTTTPLKKQPALCTSKLLAWNISVACITKFWPAHSWFQCGMMSLSQHSCQMNFNACVATLKIVVYMQNQCKTPCRINRNLKLTSHQMLIWQPHTDLYIACLPMKMQSQNDNWRRPYAMAGYGRVAAIMAHPSDSDQRKMVDCMCAMIIRQLTASPGSIDIHYLTLKSLCNCWGVRNAFQR